MALEADTKESFSKFADRVARDDIDILITIGGKAEKDEDGETIGVHASNIADGDAVEMTHLLIKFLESFTTENVKGGLYIVATMLRTIVKTQHGIDLTDEDIVKGLVNMIDDIKPTSH